MQGIFNFDDILLKKSEEVFSETLKQREEIQKTCFFNQKKVLEAFIAENVSDFHFTGTTGYGFSDAGRETLDRVYARIFKTQAGLVRHSLVSGTHALASVLFGNLRPGDELLCGTGDPYDTIKPVLGLDKTWGGGLDEWNISTRIVPLGSDGKPDAKKIVEEVSNKTRMLYLQRSCGYNWYPSVSVNQLGEIIQAVKKKKKDVIVMIDNCYGEMVEKLEPTQAGADVMGGSLIKNMGGSIAPTGGYIVGTEETVARATNALTCPGIGADEGATLGLNRLLFQGAFFAPKIVAEALSGVVWAACLLEKFGFETKPHWNEIRTDIIQGIKLGSVEKQKVFCRGIQNACPVDHRAAPEPADLPGYRDPILMAGGTFIQGSSIELSCDGPLRPPYAVYLQGGISFEHIQIGVLNAIQEMKNSGFIK